LNGTSKKDALLKELSDLWRNGAFRIVVLLVFLLLGYFILQGTLVLVLRTEYPLHTPISGSMEPTLKVGDLLIIQGGLSGSDVYANRSDGDIIIFRNPWNPNGIPIVHRAIDKFQEEGKWYFRTKGDHNPDEDRWLVPEDYLFGKVIISIPLLGYFYRLLDDTQIYLGGYVITLRMAIIVSLIVAMIVLEYTSTSGGTMERQKTRDSNEREEDSQG
jgi:signal peptidase